MLDGCARRAFALLVEGQLLGQCGRGAHLVQDPERAHRGIPHVGVRIVDRFQQHVACLRNAQAGNDARRRRSDFRVVMIECLDEASRLIGRQWRLRDHAQRVRGFEPDARVVVVDRLDQAGDELGRN